MSMTTFHSVNTTQLAPNTLVSNAESTTPTTPRPSTAPDVPSQSASRIDDATTPTRATFALTTQRPLPASPFPTTVSLPESTDSDGRDLQGAASQHSAASKGSEDVDMDGSDDGEDGSEEESINPDGTRSTKKKKSQKFYCTDFPPCNLSFTRSEHLARHIRKHTGERPFQCHCSRRFSRLDNLRQHAQTVHVNEDIPPESLAATGTRFQRQVRTDRVRPPGNRSRASTAGSVSSQVRGHHRNSLSASSITSIGSTYSTRDDIRRRPPPLVMAHDPRARHPHETYGSRPQSPVGPYYRPQSPGGFSTPPSATYSTGQNSPRWGSAMHSPISSHSRRASLYADHRTPGRRLSVPSGANPFQSPYNSYGSSMLSPLNSATQSNFPPGGLSSPTSSTSGSVFSRRESMSSVSDDAWRRRTWHPETHTGFTSRLANVTTINQYEQTPPPQQYPVQPPRLPGIESFDPIHRPGTPPRRIGSPMVVDLPHRQVPAMHPEPQIVDPRQQYDRSLTQNLNRLEIAHQPIRENIPQWAQETDKAVMQVEPPRPQVRFEQPAQYAPYPPQGRAGETLSAPPITPRTQKRQAWYHGPITAPREIYQRTSPEGSSGSEGVPTTPSSNSVTESYPGIMHSNGVIEPSKHVQIQPYGPASNHYIHNAPPPPSEPTKQSSDMQRLEALVAVATRDENASAY